MNTRIKIRVLLSTILFILSAFTSSFCETAEPDYYHIGLKVSALMSGITDSDAYFFLVGPPEMYREAREKVNTHDYDRPVAVYSVRLDDPKAFIEEMLLKDQESREVWDSLSPVLQEQFLGRISVQSLCSSVNVRMSTEYIVLSSAVSAFIRDETLTADEPPCYLYIFEDGTPILVSFGYRTASGQFLFIPEESRGSPDSINAYLDIPFLELTPVKTGYAEVSGMASGLAAHGVNMEDALRRMAQSIAEQIPASGRMYYPDGIQPRVELFDITDDGCDDLCTCVTWGSGMVRTDLVVFDPLNEDLYVLDGYSYDYVIDHAEESRIVIVKEGPHGYGDPVTKSYGTVKLENRQLIFVADPEQP